MKWQVRGWWDSEGVVFKPSQLNDDVVLFATYSLLKECNPHVVTVFRSSVQERFGITAKTREKEDREAFGILGASCEQWPFRDSEQWGGRLAHRIRKLARSREWGRVYAPAWEKIGHPQHNAVAALADLYFGPERVTHYMTYTHRGKSTSMLEVDPVPEHVTLKLRAMACYRSQIETPGTGCRTHFMRDLFEYHAGVKPP